MVRKDGKGKQRRGWTWAYPVVDGMTVRHRTAQYGRLRARNQERRYEREVAFKMDGKLTSTAMLVCEQALFPIRIRTQASGPHDP
jgi:hypothetical protein